MMAIKERHFSPLEDLSLEELVPKDNFYRRLDAALFAFSLLGATLAIEPALFEMQLGHPVGWSDYPTLAWVAASMAIVGGALGSGLESEDNVRAAYSYRHRRRNECDEVSNADD